MSENEFNRMSFKERGHFPNTPRLFPVKALKTSDEGIKILQGSEWVCVPWEEIIDAFIEKKPSVKGYGAAAGIDYYKRTCHLKTRLGNFKFDVSNSFPDFINNKELVKVLHEYLEIRFVKKTKRNEHIFNAALMAVLIFLIWWLR